MFLCEIEDVFWISGRGCVIVPGVPTDCPINVKVRDKLRIVRPDGSELTTTVAGIEHGDAKQQVFPLLLPIAVTKDQVPLGSKVYPADEES